MPDLAALTWPVERLGEALDALARQAGLAREPLDAPPPPEPDTAADPAALGDWLDWAAERLGLELEEVEAAPTDLPALLRASGPALVRSVSPVSDGFLLLLGGARGCLRLLAPDLRIRKVPAEALRSVLCAGIEGAVAAEVEALLEAAGIPHRRGLGAARALLDERLAGLRIQGIWLLRALPGRHFRQQLLAAGAPQRLGAMVGAFALLYGLEILGWLLIGQGALEGRLDPGWLLAWALLLLTMVPIDLAGRWLQGRLALDVGGRVKQRLLAGALQMDVDHIRQQGAGQLLGQVIESQALESLSLNGGFAVLVAGVELLLAAWVLSVGAGALPHVLLLTAWLALTLALGWRYARQLRRWTQARLGLTHDLVERMVGHRTRLAQESPRHRHEDEDRELDRFLAVSGKLDRQLVPLFGGLPRGWLVVGLIGLTPAFVLGGSSTAALAIGLGGVLLAYRAFGGVASGLAALARAWVAWEAVAPLFAAARRKESPPAQLPAASGRTEGSGIGPSPLLVQARDLVFRYRPQGEPVLRGCSLSIRRGDRLLLEGPSGGGKSTFAALLVGLRQPQSGLLLLDGLDRATLGTGWRRLSTSAPQFHENHVLTGTFAFNLLLGRAWPPADADLDEAEALCQELGLGPLLERMPSGLMQMVGETGWQLSHGERSRLFLARALLQKTPLVVLDESFAALDPQTLEQCLRTALSHAETLLVIAHP